MTKLLVIVSLVLVSVPLVFGQGLMKKALSDNSPAVDCNRRTPPF